MWRRDRRRDTFVDSLAAVGILTIALLACKKEAAKEQTPAKEEKVEVRKTECKSGETSSCKCDDGADGSRECDEKGAWKSCGCKTPEPEEPKGSPPSEQVLGPDGLPEEIPPPGSKPPTTSEWDAVPKECTVKGSSALKCNTWMVREWLKVNCHTNHLGRPRSVELHAGGVQAFKFVRPGEQTSAVVQVVRSRRSTATYLWDGGRKTLVVDWPHGAPRPNLHFE
jgi:hypothetical protein